MKVERLDLLAIQVKDLDEAMGRFSDLLGITFKEIPMDEIKDMKKILTEHADREFEETPYRAAISPIGLELIQPIPPSEKEGLRAFCLKVSDLDQAKKEMKEKGILLRHEWLGGGLKEAVYGWDDLHGVRMALAEYDASNQWDAILQK